MAAQQQSPSKIAAAHKIPPEIFRYIVELTLIHDRVQAEDYEFFRCIFCPYVSFWMDVSKKLAPILAEICFKACQRASANEHHAKVAYERHMNEAMQHDDTIHNPSEIHHSLCVDKDCMCSADLKNKHVKFQDIRELILGTMEISGVISPQVGLMRPFAPRNYKQTWFECTPLHFV